MIWRWLIFFSVCAGAAAGASVSGQVELTNSHEAAVRRNKDYSGVVIWLTPAGAASAPAPARREVMRQLKRHFVPHVVAVPVGGSVDFPNLDPIFHNAFSNFSGQPFDVGLYAPGTSKTEVFRHPGIVRVFCNIHSTMSAIIAVVPTPWYATTPASGRFTIASVPPGEYDLHIFHERAQPDVLRFLEHRVTVSENGLALPLISISETGYIPAPHLNKYGKPYPPLVNDTTYPGAQK